jgi:catechol 2,3-dioxygenase-like lactoylglutathione lyase family enzyme
MIDHISVRVQDFSKAVEFYRAALEPLGYQVLMQFEGAAGLGAGGMPDLWIMQTEKALNPTHVAISGERSQIDAFHGAALAAGATDNGPPGPRVDYHPHYYAAFVLDPEGNNLEVVCHTPEGTVAASSRPRAAKKSAKAATRPAKKTAKKSAKKSAKSAKTSATSAKKAVPAKKSAKAAKKSGKSAAKKRR